MVEHRGAVHWKARLAVYVPVVVQPLVLLDRRLRQREIAVD